MAAAVSSSSYSATPTDLNHIHDLNKEIRQHQVAIEELNNLPSTRSVYVKKSNIYFRTSIEKATTSEKRQLDVSKRKLQNLDNK